MLAVALTALLLMVLAPEAAAQDEGGGAGEAAETTKEILRGTGETAKETVSGLWDTLLSGLPRILLTLGVLLAAWVLTRLVRVVTQRALGSWERRHGLFALASVGIWVVAVGVAVSVLAQDVRGLIGSLGLVGLALSWALQAPIESFTGWVLNALRGYYRVGDRIEVGEVFGDVHRIDLLTTTVWEIGSPFKDNVVKAEQPTGRLITFPNSEVLNGTVVNLTRDYQWLWDEATLQVTNESDLRYAALQVQKVADGWLGDQMEAGAVAYEAALARSGLAQEVPRRPEVFVGLNESWTDVTVRYLVPARQRRRWKSELVLRLSETLALPEHAEKIRPAFPRRQLEFITPE